MPKSIRNGSLSFKPLELGITDFEKKYNMAKFQMQFASWVSVLNNRGKKLNTTLDPSEQVQYRQWDMTMSERHNGKIGQRLGY